VTKSGARFDAVCFDCDSTLSRIEGIDELARRVGCEAQIAPLTEAAMDGRLSLDEVYAKRLDIVRPDRAMLNWLGARYVEEMVPGARETVATLRRVGKPVYIVSGGLLPAVAILAEALAVPPEHVRAVEVFFDDAGGYRHFDTASPLTRSDGKATVCQEIAARHGRVALVGDGVTDLAARAAGAIIIGFGGVAVRQAMAEGADCFIAAPSLMATLAALLTDAEYARATLPGH